MILTHQELATLNGQARELLARVGALGQGVSSLQTRLVLDEQNIRDLNGKLDGALVQLIHRQADLERLVQRGDPRVLELLSSLRGEVQNLGTALGEQQTAVSSLSQRYPLQPVPGVVPQVINLAEEVRSKWTPARILGDLANVVSIGVSAGKKIGPVTLNIFGILAALADLLL
jgi:chromosome segregation ATPase